MTFDFEAIKAKYSQNTESKVFVGNADEIRGLIAGYEEKRTALEDMSKELKIANDMIKDLKNQLREKSPESTGKAPYDDPND